VSSVKYSEKKWKEIFLIAVSASKLSDAHLKKSASIQWAANKHINPSVCASMWLGFVTSLNIVKEVA
jgi:hypothetical protein